MKTEKPIILIVDDEPCNIEIIVNILKDTYKTIVAKNGKQAIKRCQANPPPDLILLDIIMPEMSGYEVCKQLKSDPDTQHIPIIFITGMRDASAERNGLELGAVDYITKPISPHIVRARVKNHILLVEANHFLHRQNIILEHEVDKRTKELAATQDVAILCLASLAETRDNETGNHIRRTQYYTRTLANQLRSHPRFSEYLTADTINLIFKSAPLHDIGKVGIPDAILLKPGPLTEEEFKIMKTHTTLGRDAIQQAETELGFTTTSFLRYAKDIAISHHEKWDGSGYPKGLKGDEIPVSGRLMAIADVYDALISKRIYKPAFPHEKVVDIISSDRGKHFDPDITDAFEDTADAFFDISRQFRTSVEKNE